MSCKSGRVSCNLVEDTEPMALGGRSGFLDFGSGGGVLEEIDTAVDNVILEGVKLVVEGVESSISSSLDFIEEFALGGGGGGMF